MTTIGPGGLPPYTVPTITPSSTGTDTAAKTEYVSNTPSEQAQPINLLTLLGLIATWLPWPVLGNPTDAASSYPSTNDLLNPRTPVVKLIQDTPIGERPPGGSNTVT